MLATVFTKALRDRWIGVAIGAGSVALFLLYGMSIYRNIDLSLYTDLPESMRALFGIGDAADAGSLAYGAIYGFAGSLTLAGLALSMGASSIAGEERDGTMGLLLGNPRSRTHVLVSKAGAIVALTAAGALFLWAAGLVVPELLNVDVSAMHPGAQVLHIFVNALFYGFLALALGAWTGNRTVASGTTVAVMLVSYVAVGVLPLVTGLADLARLFPWHYFDAGDPVRNGVQWSDLGVLAGGAAIFLALALVGVNRRDLREKSVTGNLLDRLRAHPLTERVVDRLAGTARVSAIWVKTASEHQGLLVITALIMVSMGVMLGPMYGLIDDRLIEFSEQIPEALLAMIGSADLGTPEGWYQTETYSFMAPISVIVVVTVVAARALAGEEARGTMGLLLANPMARSRVVLEKAFAMTVYSLIVGLFTFAGTALGSLVGGLGMSMVNVAVTSLLASLVGLVFGAVALTLGAATGRVKAAVYGTAGLALASFLLNSFLPLSERAAGYARGTPFYYYLTSDPLSNGMPWGHAAVLVTLIAGLVLLAVTLFERRDLRQPG